MAPHEIKEFLHVHRPAVYRRFRLRRLGQWNPILVAIVVFFVVHNTNTNGSKPIVECLGEARVLTKVLWMIANQQTRRNVD